MGSKPRTLSVSLQDGFIWLVGMLHGDGLWEFSQHPLLEGFQSLVVMATANILFVLEDIKAKS